MVPRFLKLAAKGGVALAGLAAASPAAAQVRVFPPPPPLTSPIEGMIDFHVHSSPDVFGRAIDDPEVTRKAIEARMGVLVLKNHVMETGARAYLARRLTEGRMLPAVIEVMKVCAKQNLVLCTGHASAAESLTLVKQTKDVGVKHVVVTHAMFTVVNMTTEQMEQVAAMGAKIEIDFLGALMASNAHMGWMAHWKNVSVKDNAIAIKEVGAQHFVMGSDLGQTGNPSPMDGMKAMVAGLRANGVTDTQIKQVARDNVAAMLGL